MSQTICVLGCSGFVGSHVTKTLLDRGDTVHGTLRDAHGPHRHWIDAQIGTEPQLRLFSAELRDRQALRRAMEGCSGVLFCAGNEKQEPETIDLMVGGAEAVLDVATELGIEAVVLLSSTGSTNPPSGDPEVKNEVDHWSDPEVQKAAGKFSPAAKTLMDQHGLQRMQSSGGRLRVSILNPSMVTGPTFSDRLPGNLRFVEAVLSGQRMQDGAPNGSMSFIDVRDLAALMIAAMESPEASGRYFGVKKSWHWDDVLKTLEEVCRERNLDYTAPPARPEAERARPTTFDLTRRRSLGVPVRDLREMLGEIVDELSRLGRLP